MAGAAASVQQEELHRRRAEGAKYRVRDAWFYPFRGMGLFMFLAAFVSLLFVEFLKNYGLACVGIVVWVGWLTLVAGLQFRIVKTTADGDDELPDWPEYFSLGERFVEFFTWVFVGLLQWLPLVLYLTLFGRAGLRTNEPSLVFWIGAALCLWLGSVLAIMGFGAAAVHWKHQVLRIDRHLRGFLATGGDGLLIANVVFSMIAAVLLVQVFLVLAFPILGVFAVLIVSLYWLFLEPHLAGLLFRRYADQLEAIYEP